ncbi:MAG: OmpA family protein [Carboxylicivirga sp.]|jgi:outer membrane protein OmpA-like peptidoglycan-associated protein|nr:OmpA family protein [Carboxylicivirga sp.]
MNKYILLLSVFILSIAGATAQKDFGQLSEEQIYRKGNKYNTWSVTVGVGPVIYYTDVIDYTVFPSSNWKFAPTVMISKQFNRPWGLDLQWLKADMYGQKNHRYFEGDLYDITLNGTFNINQLAIFGPISDKWNIYAKLGIGLTYFRSKLYRLTPGSYTDPETGEIEFLNPGDVLKVKHVYENVAGYPTPHGWLSEDYLVQGYERRGSDAPDKETKRQNEIVIPFGIGVKYRVSKSFDIGTEVLMRKMNGDNLDVNLTGADNDSYMLASVNLTYKIGKKNKRHASWTYKDFNMNYKRRRNDDPMAHKLDSLKRQIALIASMDSVKADTSTIVTESVEYKETVTASIFFDFDKSNITKDAHMSLAKVAYVMNQDKSLRVKIVGYTDERGSYEYNVKLSQRRCQAALKVLVDEYDIDADRFVIDYKGEAELLSDTQKLAPRGLHLVNRRVDLFVIIE